MRPAFWAPEVLRTRRAFPGPGPGGAPPGPGAAGHPDFAPRLRVVLEGGRVPKTVGVPKGKCGQRAPVPLRTRGTRPRGTGAPRAQPQGQRGEAVRRLLLLDRRLRARLLWAPGDAGGGLRASAAARGARESGRRAHGAPGGGAGRGPRRAARGLLGREGGASRAPSPAHAQAASLPIGQRLQAVGVGRESSRPGDVSRGRREGSSASAPVSAAAAAGGKWRSIWPPSSAPRKTSE